MTFERVLRTGTMPGLMTLFGRHSGLYTNFKIYYPESRLYWPREAYPTGAGAQVCGEARKASECLGDAVGTGYWHWLGPGNTNLGPAG